MGGNIDQGTIDKLTDKQRKEFSKNFHQKLDEMKMEPEERERRHDEGPPIFHEGEVLELRGMRFRVGRIDTNKLLLRPIKG